MMILSGDPPRSRALSALLIVVVLALALAPFLFPGAKPLNVAANICIYALLAASYDLLLGYTGIVSFAHVMFFGVGAYGVAIALYGLGPGWGALALGVGGGAAGLAGAGPGDRAVFAARADDLLRHGDAGGRLRLQRAGLAAVLADRRRGRALVPGPVRPAAGFPPVRRRDVRRARSPGAC